MTMQATLSYGANKTQATFNAGAFVAPAATQICVYVNLVAGQYYRDVDVASAIENLAKYARETAAQFEALATPIYFIMPIGGGKGAIINDANLAEIGAGEVALGFGANVPLTSTGPVSSIIKELSEAMWEQDRIYA